MSEKDYKKFRCKLSCGLSVSWHILKVKDGWRTFSVGKAKSGRDHVPNNFIPFLAQNAAVNPTTFPTLAECENYLRSL